MAVAQVWWQGTCDTTEDYDYTETPAPTGGPWTYVVEVIKTDASRQCAVDVVPE